MDGGDSSQSLRTEKDSKVPRREVIARKGHLD